MTIKPSDITIVSAGEEFSRRGDKKLVAISRVSITFDNKEDLDACIKALQESDEQLAKLDRPRYDWQLVYVYEYTISFGVAWYDKKFFEEKKDAFKDPNHSVIFGKFGKVPSDFEVQHFVAID